MLEKFVKAARSRARTKRLEAAKRRKQRVALFEPLLVDARLKIDRLLRRSDK